jgi:hypothetical protein
MHKSLINTDNLGTIHGLSSSGSDWDQDLTGNIRQMFFDTINTKNVIGLVQISTFSLGHGNEEVKEFFNSIRKLLLDEKKVLLIVNDNEDKQSPTCTGFAKTKMKELKKLRKEKFEYHLFKSNSTHAGKYLHAKLVVVDRTIALVGSANISKRALSSNYEIMLKVSGKEVCSRLSLMLDNLAKMLGNEEES